MLPYIATINNVVMYDNFSECPNYGAIIPTLLEHDIEELPKRCKLTPGTFQFKLYPLTSHGIIDLNT